MRFENVSAYEPGNPVLKNISLMQSPGKNCLCRIDCAGKTTITNLINRFYDVNEGKSPTTESISSGLRKDDLRRSLSMVLQDTHLFTDTVMENIRYGNRNATDEQVIHAAKLANADFFITHLPNGYQTVLYDDGENLSQGQRQLRQSHAQP